MLSGSPIAKPKRAQHRSSRREFERRLKKKANDEIVGQVRRLPSQGNRSGRPTIASLQDLPSAKARFVEPMKAKLVEKPPEHSGWIYEMKFDGIRLINIKTAVKVTLLAGSTN